MGRIRRSARARVHRTRVWLADLRRRVEDRVLRDALLPPREGFDRWAAVYEQEADNPLLLLDARVLGALLEPTELAGTRVLDYGCGLGRHWPALLAHQPASLTGADISPAMLDRARARYPAHPLIQLPAEPSHHAGPLAAAGPFDRVITAQVLHYVDDLPATFAALRGALAPGGEVVLTLLHPEVDAADVHFRDGQGRVRLPVARFTLADLRRAWAAAGFEPAHEVHAPADASLEAAFERHGGRDVYARALGRPLVYGARLRLASP